MSYIDQRGHRVPSPTDPAQRADLTALSLSIPSIRTVVSETAAAQYVASLQGAGVRITETNPAFVYQVDTGNIRAWNGGNGQTLRVKTTRGRRYLCHRTGGLVAATRPASACEAGSSTSPVP